MNNRSYRVQKSDKRTTQDTQQNPSLVVAVSEMHINTFIHKQEYSQIVNIFTIINNMNLFEVST